MKKITLGYFGAPDFSANFLEKILKDSLINQLIEVKFVVSQPDKPVGRKQILTPTAVKTIALQYGLEVLEKEKIESKISNVDLCLIYAYSGIIPKKLLYLPKHGFWCLHPSLLPKYRGTSPMATALINGDQKTGMTIMKVDNQIDHGPIIAQESLTIQKDDKRPDLENKLTNLGLKMFEKIINQLINLGTDELKTTEQNHQQTTFTKKLSKQDGFVLFENLKAKINNSSEDLFNLFRGLYPWPGIWTILPNGKRLKITDLTMQSGNLAIKTVQLEGKKAVDFETFNNAYKIF